MLALRPITCVLLTIGLLSASRFAPSQSVDSASVSLPRYVSFTGELKNQEGKPASGTVDVTFLLYEEEAGGQPLWTENQRVTLDASGHFAVTLGANSIEGLPMVFFTSKKAHWLAMEPEGLPMTDRVLLLSVPYAYKAGDAETLGGLPASAFLRAGSPGVSALTPTPAIAPAPNVANTPGGGGTANYVPLWTPDGNTLGNSVLYQSGKNIGLGTVTPASALQVYSGDLTVGPAALKFPTTPGGTASINQLAGGFLARMALADGSGRLNMYWNAYSDAVSNVNKYYSSGEPATKWNVGGANGSGGTALYVAPAGTAGGAIDWKTVFSSDVNANVSLANNAMNLKSGGNVGIGTAAPAAKLEVNGTGKFDGLVTFASGQTFPGTLTQSNGDGRYAQLAANNVYSGVQVINNSVGIGIVPTVPLHVQGVIRSETGGLSLGGSAQLSVDAPFIPGGHLLVDGNGNVGINNPNPQQALDVIGNVNASGSLGGSSLSVTGAGVIGGSLQIKNDTPMNAAPHMYFTGYVEGPMQALFTEEPIVVSPSRDILVTRMVAKGLNTCPGNGDLTFDVEAADDISPLNTLVLSSDSNFPIADSGPLSIPLTGGVALLGKVNPPDCGAFGTAPEHIAVSIEYVMR